MDSELIRFRVDRQTRHQALDACAKAGVSLGDALRAFTAWVAREQRLPPELLHAVPRTEGRAPFSEYEPRLWATMLPLAHLDLALWAAGDAMAAAALAALLAGSPASEAHASAVATIDALCAQPTPQVVQAALDAFGLPRSPAA